MWRALLLSCHNPPTHKPFDGGELNAISGDPDTVTIKHIAVYFHIHTFQVKM